MTMVACLGWGSLIWDPRTLPIRRHWLEDGPLVRAEFLRESNDGRITLVLHESVSVPVRALWAVMDMTDTARAVTALRKREGIPERREPEWIGVWTQGEDAPPEILDLPASAQARSVSKVIWTALPPKLGDEIGKVAAPDEISGYLSALTGSMRDEAARYVRLAPRQIDTAYRRQIEAVLGWTPLTPPEPPSTS